MKIIERKKFPKIKINKKRQPLTYQKLRDTLNYNPITGIFTWKISGKGINKSIAGSKNSEDYIIITINKQRYGAHRLAWLYIYGYFPENGIDHKDRIRYHNWISNLREASPQCNMRNRKVGKNNKTGISGVYYDKSTSKWVAFIYINRICKKVGSFTSFEETVCHRLAAEQCVDWNNCLNNSSAYKYVKEKIQKGGFYSEPRNIIKDVNKKKEASSHKEHKKKLNKRKSTK